MEIPQEITVGFFFVTSVTSENQEHMIMMEEASVTPFLVFSIYAK